MAINVSFLEKLKAIEEEAKQKATSGYEQLELPLSKAVAQNGTTDIKLVFFGDETIIHADKASWGENSTYREHFCTNFDNPHKECEFTVAFNRWKAAGQKKELVNTFKVSTFIYVPCFLLDLTINAGEVTAADVKDGIKYLRMSAKQYSGFLQSLQVRGAGDPFDKETGRFITISRTGKDSQTTYTFTVTPDVLPLPESVYADLKSTKEWVKSEIKPTDKVGEILSKL